MIVQGLLAAVVAFGLLGAPLASEAQPARLPLVAILDPGLAAAPSVGTVHFKQTLEQLGWVEGQTIRFETRYGEYERNRTAAMARELIALKPVTALALRHQLPTMSQIPRFAERGGLLQYGADVFELFRRSATHVDKILRGAKVGDLPVEQPTKIDFIINMKTAKALGLTISPSMLLRANQIIEGSATKPARGRSWAGR
jgi:hypothetical protein